jgi:UDP-N-acetylglucosamine--dolichyl-phosphate N-acetylglucosaminephosphotransferase
MPSLIKYLRKRGIVATDYYKRDLRKIPTGGGILILLSLAAFFGINGLFYLVDIKLFDLKKIEWYSALVVLYFGSFGLIDDFWDVGRVSKIFAPLFFSLPLSFVLPYTELYLPFFGYLDIGGFYLLFMALYVMVVANLVNMHSGFNGMCSGLSSMLMATLLIKSFLVNRGAVFMLSCVLGATIGFFWYNKYPSRIFDGNVGSLIMGAAIGVGIITGRFIISGFVMLIPHILNFLMYVYWRLMHRLYPKDERWKIVKFGKVGANGILEVPNRLTLKWVLPYYFKMTEKQAVLAMYALTAIFCIIGFFIPY